MLYSTCIDVEMCINTLACFVKEATQPGSGTKAQQKTEFNEASNGNTQLAGAQPE